MNRVSSIFSQIVHLVPRSCFASLVAKHKAERHSRGFSSWAQFIAILFCQLGDAQSLREIVQGLAAAEGKLHHLGLDDAPTRSTLTYANQHGPAALYQELFHRLSEELRGQLPGHRFAFKHKLASLDSTLITLCARSFPWAHYQRTKGAVNLHLLLDHAGHMPAYAVITEGNTSDIAVARQLDFTPGALLLFDRGYVALDWLAELHRNGVFFVTRLKEAMHFEVLETAAQSKAEGVLSDETGYQPGHAAKGKEIFLRRVRYYDHEQQREFTFLTNHLDLPAETVAALYRECWRIETFFRALKQNLRIKSFVGTRENALATQMYCALIGILLIAFLKHRAKYGWSLSNLEALLRQQLLVYRDLWLFLDRPFEGPPGANVEEEPPPPLLAAPFEMAADTQPQPNGMATSARKSMVTVCPALEGG